MPLGKRQFSLGCVCIEASLSQKDGIALLATNHSPLNSTTMQGRLVYKDRNICMAIYVWQNVVIFNQWYNFKICHDSE